MVTPSRGLSADQYEEIAWALDALSKLARPLLEPLAAMTELNLNSMEVTVKLTNKSRSLSSSDAKLLLEWLDGDDMQQDLRRLAREAL